jgi:hypothetical protein
MVAKRFDNFWAAPTPSSRALPGAPLAALG